MAGSVWIFNIKGYKLWRFISLEPVHDLVNSHLCWFTMIDLTMRIWGESIVGYIPHVR